MTASMGIVPKIPIKRRPRFGKHGAYVDSETKADEKAVRESYHGMMHTGPVGVRIHVYKPLKSGKKNARNPFTAKPDVDNIAKAVLDGLNGVAYQDDSQVITLEVVKHDREKTGIEQTIYVVFDA